MGSRGPEFFGAPVRYFRPMFWPGTIRTYCFTPGTAISQYGSTLVVRLMGGVGASLITNEHAVPHYLGV